MSAPPRIIFVPGMKPKPPAAPHRQALLRVLLAGLARTQPDVAAVFAADAERFTLVSWTGGFYGTHRNLALDLPGIERLLRQPEANAEDIREITSLRRRLLRRLHLLGDTIPLLRRVVASREMRLTLAEVARYFDDEDGAATRIRGLLKVELSRAWDANERVLLIGHSLGSIIAYDTLWEMGREGAPVDLFMTLGSPLSTCLMRGRLRGAHCNGRERYPSLMRRWVNFSAVGDLTALRPVLPFFSPMLRYGLVESIEDRTGFYTHYRGVMGLNVHMAYGYLIHPEVTTCIGDWWLGA